MVRALLLLLQKNCNWIEREREGSHSSNNYCGRCESQEPEGGPSVRNATQKQLGQEIKVIDNGKSCFEANGPLDCWHKRVFS